MAILGPNGSGKSTFVNLLTREVLPIHRDEPPVLFRGRANTELQEVKRQVGFVSASMQGQISVHLPAVQIVEGGLFGSLGRPMRREVTDAQHEQALRAMDQLGIGDLAERDVMTLSTGQARRVLVARALVHDPSVLVFDEPCTGLDPEGMYHVRQAMSKVACDGRSVVLVTHYPEDIVSEISRVLFLKDGSVVLDGPRSDVLTPANLSQLFGVPITLQP
ncbi:MAG: ATP-binding cassette domain-containing protein [Eggerthellaceae bacterium]|nr:ATP-binding cassette domain-containing protein [Eggerthellaceae bacterium]